MVEWHPSQTKSEAYGYSASPDTLLRRVRTTPDLEAPARRVVGVDDWCFLRGRRYGAILVDLERHYTLDLPPDREADTLANWLKAHPDIDVISRDRGGSFAEGATRGAPHATQVADWFHLLKNLVAAFQQTLSREHKALRAAAETAVGAPLLSSPAHLLPQNAMPAIPHMRVVRSATRRCDDCGQWARRFER